MSAQKNPPSGLSPQRENRGPQASLITLRASGRRWSVRPRLAKGQIAAQHGQSTSAKCLCQRRQQGTLAIRTGAMGQDQPIGISRGSAVQEAAYALAVWAAVCEFF
jgi:hypothetical protein